MELHAFYRKLAVPQSHDLSVLGLRADLEARGQAVALDHERVVSRRHEIVLDFRKNAAAVMADAGNLAVHHLLCAHDPAAERLPDGLMAEAHAEDRHATGKPLDRF